MAGSLSNLVNNLAEGFLKLYVNMNMMIKYVKLVKLNTNIASAFLNTQALKVN